MKPRIRVSLYLHGDSLDPNYVTSVLGVEPTRAHRKGEKEPTSHGTTVVAKTGLWVRAATLVDEPLEVQLDEILSSLRVLPSKLVRIEGVEDAYVAAFVGVSLSSEYEPVLEFVMEASVVMEMGRLGLSCRLTFSAVVADLN